MLATTAAIGIISILAMIILIYLGMHIAVALLLISFVCIVILRGDIDVALSLLALTMKDGISSYSFAVVPLFVLMGALITVSDIGKDLYNVFNAAFRKVTAGLGIATVAANTVFAAVTGVSIASSVVFARIAVPEMRKHGYSRRFSVGVVAGSSVLGMLIPPSVLLIVYALIAQVSVRDMFVAGAMPGLLLALAYVTLIILLGKLCPGFVFARERPPSGTEKRATPGDGDVRGSLAKVLPIAALIFVMFGGIYGGIFTATEGGAVGCLAAFVLTAMRGKLGLRETWVLVTEASRTTASILIIIIAALVYSRMLGIAGVPSALSSLLASMEFSAPVILLIYVVIMLMLGMILDSTSIILVLVPLFLPVAQTFGFDLVWFGIITVVGVEIGLLTPPLGLTCFVVRGALEDQNVSLADVFLGALPFAATMLAVLIILIVFPGITLFLV